MEPSPSVPSGGIAPVTESSRHPGPGPQFSREKAVGLRRQRSGAAMQERVAPLGPVAQISQHLEPELGPRVGLDPQPEDLLLTVGPDAQCPMHGSVLHRALVADLHPQGIEDHKG